MPDRHIFRMTYFKNIEQFLVDNAVLAKNHNPMQRCYRTSFDDIVNKRGTDFFTPAGEVINDFVPFYFSPITGMAFSIYKHNVKLISPAGVNLGPADSDDMVYLVSNTVHFQDNDFCFWFTDIAVNSAAHIPKYENDLSKLDIHVDWPLFEDTPTISGISEVGYLGACRWFHHRDTPKVYNNRDKKRMAEFMVKEALPLSLVDCIIVKHDHVKQQIDAWMQASSWNIPVYVKAGCYF